MMAKGKRAGYFPPIKTATGSNSDGRQEGQEEKKKTSRIDELARHRTLAPGHTLNRWQHD